MFLILYIARSSKNYCNSIAGGFVPTILRLLSWRFHFYSDEGDEPPHIHVDTGDGECKFWLEPIRLARSRNVSAVELRRIEGVVYEQQQFFKEKWHEFFNC
ncbi:MAG: DUF4160 domain-containing protein [Nitrosomonadales bacterium]